VVTHRNADPDALASALLACWILKKLKASCCTIFPEGLNKLSKKIIKELSLDLNMCKDEIPEVFLVVDASNSIQLGKVYEKGKKVYVIDHHIPGDLKEEAIKSYIDRRATSNTQLLVKALMELNFELEEKTLATLGLTGMIFDSKRFQLLDVDMLDSVKQLILWGGSYERALELTTSGSIKEDFSFRIAKFKALQRMKFSKVCKELIIAITKIGSFESRVAKTLIDLGADVAVTIGYHEDELRISFRVSTDALKSDIDAFTLAKYVSEKLGGVGGGHQAAAMVHIKSQRITENYIDEIFNTISTSLPGKVARLCTTYKGRPKEDERVQG